MKKAERHHENLVLSVSLGPSAHLPSEPLVLGTRLKMQLGAFVNSHGLLDPYESEVALA